VTEVCSYCSQTACMIVATHALLVSSCNTCLCSSTKSTTGRTMLATYADAFDGTYRQQATASTVRESTNSQGNKEKYKLSIEQQYYNQVQ